MDLTARSQESRARLAHARDLFLQEDMPGAERETRLAILADVENAGAWVTLGDILSEQGRTAEAVSSLERAMALTPAWPEAYWKMANLLAGEERHGEAIEFVRKALQLARQQPCTDDEMELMYDVLVTSLEAIGRHQEALAVVRSGLAQIGSDVLMSHYRRLSSGKTQEP